MRGKKLVVAPNELPRSARNDFIVQVKINLFHKFI